MIEVMDQEQIDALEPEPLQAVLERAAQARVAVVEIVLERETAVPRLAQRIAGLTRSSEKSPDLRRKHELITWHAAQEVAHTVLGESVPVVGSRIEVADARI